MSPSWKSMISGAFGAEDRQFAGHSENIERARKLLNAAIEQGATFKEYCDAIEKWLRNSCSRSKASQEVIEKHIKDQMTKVRDLESYFSHE